MRYRATQTANSIVRPSSAPQWSNSAPNGVACCRTAVSNRGQPMSAPSRTKSQVRAARTVVVTGAGSRLGHQPERFLLRVQGGGGGDAMPAFGANRQRVVDRRVPRRARRRRLLGEQGGNRQSYPQPCRRPWAVRRDGQRDLSRGVSY